MPRVLKFNIQCHEPNYDSYMFKFFHFKTITDLHAVMLLLKYIFESSICRAPEGFMDLLPSMMRSRTVIYKLTQTQ